MGAYVTSLGRRECGRFIVCLSEPGAHHRLHLAEEVPGGGLVMLLIQKRAGVAWRPGPGTGHFHHRRVMCLSDPVCSSSGTVDPQVDQK